MRALPRIFSVLCDREIRDFAVPPGRPADDLEHALACVDAFARDQGVARSDLPLLHLALLSDAVTTFEPDHPPLVAHVHRALLRPLGPVAHAAALVDPTGASRVLLLSGPEVANHACASGRALAAMAAGPRKEEATALLDGIELGFRGRQFLGLLRAPDLADAFHAAVDRAARAADLALDAMDPVDASVEHQRGGFLGHSDLTGDLFVPLAVLDLLERAGRDVAQARRRVLDGRDLRYYRQLPAMPFDVDDAAAVLLAGASGDLGLRARRVLEAGARPDGSVSTWVELPGEPCDPPLSSWLGPYCPAIHARVLRAWPDQPGGAAFLSVQVGDDGAVQGVHYPSPVVATSAVIEALARVGRSETVGRAVGWLLERQGPLGNFGDTPFETALAILALVTAGCAQMEVLADALAFLVRTQRWDGAWEAGPWFVCPHPDGSARPFGCVALSTAAVRAALATRGGWSAPPGRAGST